MGGTGFEPVTSCMSSKRANQAALTAHIHFLHSNAGRGSRTLTPLRTADFKSALSTIPTSRQQLSNPSLQTSQAKIQRRESELNRRILVLQTNALAAWLSRQKFFFQTRPKAVLTISSTSLKRPMPTRPQASLPLTGPTNLYPSFLSRLMFS